MSSDPRTFLNASRQVTVTIEDTQHAALRALSERNGTSFAHEVRVAIDRSLRETMPEYVRVIETRERERRSRFAEILSTHLQ